MIMKSVFKTIIALAFFVMLAPIHAMDYPPNQALKLLQNKDNYLSEDLQLEFIQNYLAQGPLYISPRLQRQIDESTKSSTNNRQKANDDLKKLEESNDSNDKKNSKNEQDQNGDKELQDLGWANAKSIKLPERMPYLAKVKILYCLNKIIDNVWAENARRKANVEKAENFIKTYFPLQIKHFPQTIDSYGWAYPCIIRKDDKELQEDAKYWSFTPAKDLAFDGDKTKQYIFYKKERNPVAVAGPNNKGLMLVEDQTGDHLSLVENEIKAVNEQPSVFTRFIKKIFGNYRDTVWNRQQKKYSHSQLHPENNSVIHGLKNQNSNHYSKIKVVGFQNTSISNETEIYNSAFDDANRNPRKFVKFCFGPGSTVWLAEINKENKIALVQYDYKTKEATAVEKKIIDISAIAEKIGYPLAQCTDLVYSPKHDSDVVLIAGFCNETNEQAAQEKTIFVCDTKDKTMYAVGKAPATHAVTWNDPVVMNMIKSPIETAQAITSVQLIKPLLADQKHALEHAIQVLNGNILTQAGQHWIEQWKHLKSSQSKPSQRLLMPTAITRTWLKELKRLSPEKHTLSKPILEEGKQILDLLRNKEVIMNRYNVIRNTTNPVLKENLFRTIHKVVKYAVKTDQALKNAAPVALSMNVK